MTIDRTHYRWDGFEVSCAVGDPSGNGYWFGSENGRIRFATLATPDVPLPFDMPLSSEAINGITFTDRYLAISTRSEVVFRHEERHSSGWRATTGRFPGGAHGIMSITPNGLAAPMGPRGLLLFHDPMPDNEPQIQTWNLGINAYKLAALTSQDNGPLLAIAARGDGLVICSFDPTMPLVARRLRSPGIDFIDVTPMDDGRYPLAIAAAGRDGSVHLVRDSLSDLEVQSLGFPAGSERIYRLACSQGHLFVLTDQRLYAFAHLVTRFLGGESVGQDEEAETMDVEAIDMELAPDGSLLIVTENGVLRIAIDTLMGQAGRRLAPTSHHRPGTVPSSHPNRNSEEHSLLTSHQEGFWESLEPIDWRRSISIPLATVA